MIQILILLENYFAPGSQNQLEKKQFWKWALTSSNKQFPIKIGK